ncbi:MAG: hypothetical protein WCO84_04780 [bacterium]
MLKIAVINPPNGDGLARTVFDGLIQLKKKGIVNSFKYPNKFSYPIEGLAENYTENVSEFINFANESDFIFLIWGKGCTDFSLANKINLWGKTIFLDGSEIGKNGRYDFEIQKKIVKGEYTGNGKIDIDMLKKCPLYLKREKPYKDGVLPLPFGIEDAYVKNFSREIKKDIDFFCVFGQDEYPLMRRYSKEILIEFCAKNNFSCFTEKVERDEFYKKLARSKVGISVGGGGYDTLRFWEILGNNCLLLTEKIDIYEPDLNRLKYERIWQFNDLFDFEHQLNKIGKYLRGGYSQASLELEYEKIISEHSSESRVLEIINKAKGVGLVK